MSILDGGLKVERQADRLQKVGTLTVHVKSARDLIKADFAGLSDPYAVIRMPGQSQKRTSTQKKTLNPDWDEKLEFDCDLQTVLAAPMVVQLFDEDFSVTSFFTGHGGRGGRSSETNDDDLGSHRAHKKNTDDKLGIISALRLDALATTDYVEFDDLTLEGVSHGTISLAVSWAESTDTDSQVRSLVERRGRLGGRARCYQVKVGRRDAGGARMVHTAPGGGGRGG